MTDSPTGRPRMSYAQLPSVPKRDAGAGEDQVSGELHRDAIKAELSGMFTSNATAGAVTNGSFAFTESDMRTIIKNWLDLADNYDKSIHGSFNMTTVEGPGRDFASRMFATAANQSGESYVRYLTNNRDYCLQQAQLFQDTLDTYLGVEHTNVTEINKSDQQGPQPGV
jgi:hypothetical protein